MNKDMTYDELCTLAADTALQLSQRRSEIWTVASTKDDTWPSAELAGPAGARLRIIYGYDASGKVTVRGLYPEGVGGTAYRANVDPARGAQAVASEADRRVLNAGYLAALPKVLERKAAQDAEQARRDGLMARAGELFGIEPEPDGKVYLGKRVLGRGYVENYYADGKGALNINLSGIPADVALAMLAVLAARTEPGPSCCRDNPEHPYSWAGPDCLLVNPLPEPKPFSAAFERLYDEYLSSGDFQRHGWNDWLKSRSAR